MPKTKWRCIRKNIDAEQYDALLKTIDYDVMAFGAAATYKTKTWILKRDGQIVAKVVLNTQTGLSNVYEALR